MEVPANASSVLKGQIAFLETDNFGARRLDNEVVWFVNGTDA